MTGSPSGSTHIRHHHGAGTQSTMADEHRNFCSQVQHEPPESRSPDTALQHPSKRGFSCYIAAAPQGLQPALPGFSPCQRDPASG